MCGKTIARLLLFDIDGTLVKACHKDSVHGGDFMLKALSVAFNQKITDRGATFAGGTDRAIIDDVLSANGILRQSDKQYQEKVELTLKLLPDALKDGVDNGLYFWQSLKNVNSLLTELSKISNVRLALLTGNIWQTAKQKLQAAKIDPSLFHVESDFDMPELLGAFGSDHQERTKLVSIAKHRYKQLIRKNIDHDDIIVIGDTPKDIECAHANNVACVAVATGRYTMEDLKNAEVVLRDFSDVKNCIKLFLETKFGDKLP